MESQTTASPPTASTASTPATDGAPEVVDVPRALAQADAEMRSAIEALKRARRMRLFEFFKPVNTDPHHQGTEEVHVGHGLNALLNAERLVSEASTHIETLPADHSDRRAFGPPIRALEARFKDLLKLLRDRPTPGRIIAELKAARRAIPTKVVRG